MTERAMKVGGVGDSLSLFTPFLSAYTYISILDNSLNSNLPYSQPKINLYTDS